MKKLFSAFAAICIVTSASLSAQTVITYAYDSVGNRTDRTVSGEQFSSLRTRADGISGRTSAPEKSRGNILYSDSTIVLLPNGGRTVTYGSQFFDFGEVRHPDSAHRRSLVPSEQEKTQHFAELRAKLEQMRGTAKSPRRISLANDTSGFAVGEIPVEIDVSASGARTYNIPIVTAPGFKLVPSVSVSYNSQAGNGWVGYGWDIRGLSAISLINRNIYYHDVAEGAVADSTDAVFALDGIPLVRNADLSTYPSYPLETASGHILVSAEKDSTEYVKGFRALYPDGRVAMYGVEQGSEGTSLTYPVTEVQDMDGNRIQFKYYWDIFHENPHIYSIRYGFDSTGISNGEIYFRYASQSNAPTLYYAGKSVNRRDRVTGIISYNGTDVIGKYTLSYEEKDNVFLLDKVEYSSGSDSLRPLEFTYGDGITEPDDSGYLYKKSDSLFLSTAFTSDIDLYYKRGKFVSGSFNDGLLIYPEFSEYDAVAMKQAPLKGHKYYKYGSRYAASQVILFVASLSDLNDVDGSITAGDGFQTIEAVDVDGDGVDEIVKVNLDGTSGSSTKLLITVYKCDSQGHPVVDYSFNVLIDGVITNRYFTSPTRQGYFWGDFSGEGKVQLLTVAYDKNYNSQKEYDQVSYATLIDVDGRRKLSEEELFDFPIDKSCCLLTCDMDNDTRTELSYATDTGLDVYRLQSTNSFLKESTYSRITSSILSSITNPIYITDLNGDGYMDIVSAPVVGQQAYWTCYAFTGKEFNVLLLNLMTRTEDDEFMLIDVNRDGLPDIVRINGTGVGTYINRNGQAFGDFRQSPSGIGNSRGIVPANVVDYTGMSCFIKIDGFYACEYTYSSLSPEVRQLIKSTDSFGKSLFNTYTYLPENSRYWTDTSAVVTASAGFVRRTLPIYVLTREDAYQTAGNQASRYLNRYYSYYNGIVHNRGLGFCGFTKVRSFDYSGLVSEFVTENRNPEKFGVLTKTETRRGSMTGTPCRTVTYTYDDHSTVYGKLNPRLAESVLSDALTGIETTIDYTYDSYDYPTAELTSRRAASGTRQTEEISREYLHNIDTTRYVLGTVTAETVAKKLNGSLLPGWKERSVKTYDERFRPLISKKYVGSYDDNAVSPLSPDTAVAPLSADSDTLSLVSETHWLYDGHGNVTSEKTAQYGSSEFVGNTYAYDVAGRYLLSKTDATGLTTTYSGYDKFGKPAVETDCHGMSRSFTYDGFGNLIRTVSPDGSEAGITAVWGGPGLYSVTRTESCKPDRIVFYDGLGRELRSGVERFDGQWQYTDREYDAGGRLLRVSLPYRGTDASCWNTYTYDEYDRPVRLAEASGRVTSWSYDGLSATMVKDGIASTKTTDASGNVISVTDAGGTVTYHLRSDGQPEYVNAPGNILTSFAYDECGRKIEMTDPSAGSQTYSYVWNSDGSSSVSIDNPNGRVTTHRDKFGRTTVVEREGEYNTAYTYDAYSRLLSKQSSNGTGVQYEYDDCDRMVTSCETVPGCNRLRLVYSYGAHGELSSVRYYVQDSLVTEESYVYSRGYNTGITLSDGTCVFALVAENDFGQPTEVRSGGVIRQYGFTEFGLPTYRKMGNGQIQNYGYDFDPLTGNLLSRRDSLHNNSESFTYDGLNRLTSAGERSTAYADNGNVTSIEDLGTMCYETSLRPYQVTALIPESDSLVSSRDQYISYTCFNRPAALTEGDTGAEFYYNGDDDRVKMSVSDGSGNLLARYYVGDRYECDLTPGGMKERLYLGGDAYSAPMVMERENGGIWSIYNIGRDYLGSITQIATLNGTLVAEYSYDPWGRMRDPQTLEPYAAGEEPDLFLGRGFTGHEHLKWFGLINMNARLYDPLIGRFLSPDPYIQSLDFTQNFNRYTYALNNPLKYTDENGEFVLSTMLIVAGITAAVFGIGNLAAHAIRHDDLGHGNWAKYFFSGATAGFIVGATAYTGWGGIAALSKMSGILGTMGSATKYGILAAGGIHAASTVIGLAGGLINNGWEGALNSLKVTLGNFYLDENASFFNSVWQGISRHTWEVLQTGLGYEYTQFRNAFGSSIDRVDYFGGVTFATNENSSHRYGITIGNYCNMDIREEIYGRFSDYITSVDAMFMHEYGHTIDGRHFGPLYLFAIGIPSLISAANSHDTGKFMPSHSYKSYERRANRLSAKYFYKNYSVDWHSSYRKVTIEDYYPL